MIFSFVCFGLGFNWVLTCSRILKEINPSRREYGNRSEPVSRGDLGGWIVTLMVHYRKNRKVIWSLQLICTIGGGTSITLGIVNLVQSLTMLAGVEETMRRVCSRSSPGQSTRLLGQ